jgi:hypothetical protein
MTAFMLAEAPLYRVPFEPASDAVRRIAGILPAPVHEPKATKAQYASRCDHTLKVRLPIRPKRATRNHVECE